MVCFFQSLVELNIEYFSRTLLVTHSLESREGFQQQNMQGNKERVFVAFLLGFRTWSSHFEPEDPHLQVRHQLFSCPEHGCCSVCLGVGLPGCGKGPGSLSLPAPCLCDFSTVCADCSPMPLFPVPSTLPIPTSCKLKLCLSTSRAPIHGPHVAPFPHLPNFTHRGFIGIFPCLLGPHPFLWPPCAHLSRPLGSIILSPQKRPLSCHAVLSQAALPDQPSKT